MEGTLSAPLAIVGGLVLPDADSEPRPGAVLVEGERIAGVAFGAEAAALAARAATTIDAAGAVVMPALVNAHHHSYANALRGTENALPLELWALFTVAWGRALDARLLRLAILLGAAEMLRAGIASVIDHSPQIRLADAAFAAHEESGMRVGYAPMIHDLHDHDLLGFALPDDLRRRVEGDGFVPAELVEGAYRDLVAAARDAGGRIRILVAPNAPQRCSEAMLALALRLRDAHGLGMHMHLLETRAQAIQARRAYPRGLVAMLGERGLLAPGLAVAHGVWLAPAEREALAASGVAVVHNPASNLMLGSGRMPWAEYRRLGVTMALGSDSANTGGAADPFELMRLATMLPRLASTDPADWPTARDALRMATTGGAAALGLGGELGVLATGRLADLALVVLGDVAAPGGASAELLVRHGAPARVRATMVGGRFAYRDGRVLAFDEAAARDAFRDAAGELAERAAPNLATAREAAAILAPQLAALHAQAGGGSL